MHICACPRSLELIPSDIKNANSLRIFKEKIKFWTTDKCPCSLYKTYIGYAGFILNSSKEKEHATCGVTSSPISNDLLYIFNSIHSEIDE